jgi:hypothetical protein
MTLHQEAGLRAGQTADRAGSRDLGAEAALIKVVQSSERCRGSQPRRSCVSGLEAGESILMTPRPAEVPDQVRQAMEAVGPPE